MKFWSITLVTIICFLLIAIYYVSFDSRSVPLNNRLDIDVNLITQEGKQFTLNSLYGKPSIVFFGFTNCVKLCPTTLSNLDGWLKKADPTGNLIGAYFITVDPRRDNPELMKKFVTKFSDRIIGLSGDPVNVMKVVRRFRIYVNDVLENKSDSENKYFVDHTTALLLLNASGSIVGTIAYQEDSSSAINKINRLIAENSNKMPV
ncbi:SCO family protein [Candidatus Liberibacter americanus]|uniref:Cytochrome-c oxidase assembly factor protein n=1 Tax=Candidatus Liberibacter americanus str. Sao Paulo TaxID=1261131 RepID=U6B8N9_9HYPH|nr:SCO family protein [Candidatus Liberibacter americanus]AHA28206.1 cytochrome-c oxidase assembly factor protein [Candidatus Liberibacter americanus str. Sao Paulo]EMS36280.1 cytochrome-c oxidase assembly factor protein [Candidatus Liberibacter americanus PW_SP]